ncbi:MAG: site-2 protease family protein [Deltaproteobacteria bacterium]|nr:site-2 protease family protein [Deltaproteobacteria bacterium]
MDKKQGDNKKSGTTLLFILGCLLPLIILFVVSGLGFSISPWVFILILLLCPVFLFWIMGHGDEMEDVGESDGSDEIQKKEKSPFEIEKDKTLEEMAELFSWGVFFVKRKEVAGDAFIFEGNLRARPESALDILKGRFKEKFGNRYQLLLQQDAEERPVIVAVPLKDVETGDKANNTSSPLINIILFLATVVTTTIAGASHCGVNLFLEPSKFALGLPYAFGIMAILGIHDLGHYIFARRHGIDTTLPYFIPIPFGLGTFGAVIRMKSLVKDRKALFDTGIAGPIAGLIVTIPLLYLGLKYSTVVKDGSQAGVSLSSSVLLAFISRLSLGDTVAASHTVILHPLAFAGWLGLMITALNLLPIGQLDGGHISHALFGRTKAGIIAYVAFFAIILLGIFVWSGWLMWAIIVFFLSGARGLPPVNDVTELDRKRVVIGTVAFVLLFLIMSPLPHVFYKTLGLHCPYL